MPGSDFSIMGQILTRIFQISTKLWRNGLTLENEEVHETILDHYDTLLFMKPPIAEGELENLVRKPRRRKLLLDRPFYLPPLKDDGEFIPILQIDWNFRDKTDISIRIEMYRFIQMFEGGSQPHLRSIGFRFEIHKDSKTHDFMHVQITRIHACPDWLPTTLPCIPTITKGAVSLLFCVLASLYGKNVYNMLFSGMKISNKYLLPLKEILTI